MTKQLKDLNLLDRFLFAEAMEDSENMKDILDIILGQDTILKFLPQTEKEARTSPMNRFIKLDVCAWDVNDTVYDTEVQREDTHNLPHRSRLYQGIIDSRLLPPGTVDFNVLNDVYIILIMPFDLFGYGLYRYTFRMECEEVPGLKLSDGATRIFLNTKGKNPENVSPELVELLRYMEHSTDEVSQNCKSDRIHQMHQRICKIKSNEEIGVKFMQAWEEKILDKQKAYEEGRADGLIAGHAEGRTEGRAEGRIEGHAEGRTEGRAEGRIEGHAEGRIEGRAETLAQVHMELLEKVRKKLDKGYSPEEIADFLEEDIYAIQDLIKEIHASS